MNEGLPKVSPTLDRHQRSITRPRAFERASKASMNKTGIKPTNETKQTENKSKEDMIIPPHAHLAIGTGSSAASSAPAPPNARARSVWYELCHGSGYGSICALQSGSWRLRKWTGMSIVWSCT